MTSYSPRKTSRRAAVLAVVAAGSVIMAGCSNGDSANKAADKKDDAKASSGEAVKLVATTTQICDYVTALAGDSNSPVSLDKIDPAGKESHIGGAKSDKTANLDLTCLLAPNASAHEHEMTPQQLTALGEADMFLTSGVDLEHFLDDAVKASGFKGEMVVSTGVLSSKDIDDLEGEKAKEAKLPYTINRGTEKVEVRKWPFPPEEGESEPEFRFDPHVWTSPQRAKIQVDNISKALADKEREQGNDAAAGAIEKRGKEFATTLEHLDKWVKESIDTVPKESRVLFSSHDAFGYFSDDYGIKFIGAALSDFNSQQDATKNHIDESVKQVKESGTKALFAENSNSSKSIEAIARAAGVKAIVGEDALYGDSLGVEGSDGFTYVGSIVHNVKTMVEAWDGTPAELPSDVKAEANRK